MKITLIIALPTNKGFLFPPFPLPGLTAAPREQSSSARKLPWGCWERGSIPWERSGSKGAPRGCCSKVKWINLNWVHSRSWLFYFEKVFAHLFRLPLGLSSLSGSMGSPAETRACKGKQGLCTCLTPCCFPTCHIFHQGQCLTNRHSSSITAFVLQFSYAEHSIGSLPLALSLLQPRQSNKEKPICAYMESFNCTIMQMVTGDFFFLSLAVLCSSPGWCGDAAVLWKSILV